MCMCVGVGVRAIVQENLSTALNRTCQHAPDWIFEEMWHTNKVCWFDMNHARLVDRTTVASIVNPLHGRDCLLV